MRNKILLTSVMVVLGLCMMATMSLAQVVAGKEVSIDYTLKIDGQVVETTGGKQPLTYIHGQNMIIPGLEQQLENMKVGDQKTITVNSDDAYGAVKPELFKDMPKTVFPEGFEVQQGAVMQIQNPDGMSGAAGLIWEIKETTIVINYNHPLAGKTLEFEVKVVDVKDATVEEAPITPVVK
ncbi:MAG TPA: peptidylprolyl isomerase [Candidatus Omnitrophota bacterium]|nr:peptidylprolyl isomerase [Candidatus Omnitrophota bacterium]